MVRWVRRRGLGDCRILDFRFWVLDWGGEGVDDALEGAFEDEGFFVEGLGVAVVESAGEEAGAEKEPVGENDEGIVIFFA